MAFILQPALVEDAEAITDIFEKAFADDYIMQHMRPNVPKEVQWQKDLEWVRGWFEQAAAYGARITKVVENDTGKIVAFSRWDYPVKLTPEQLKEKEEKEAKREVQPEGSNVKLIDDFFGQLVAGRKKWIDIEKTYFLHLLAVHPSYHGRGLGTRLIAPGLEAADKAGAQAYIEASPSGLPLYLKHGWEPVDELVIDMKPHGGEGIRRQKFLIREPHVPNELKTN